MFQNKIKVKNGTLLKEKTLGSLKPIMLRVPIQFDESKSSDHLSKYLFKS